MKETNKRKRDVKLGLVGEYYVLYRLAKMGIHTIKVSDMFDFDLLTNTGIRIEVKTATKGLCSKKYKNKTYKWYAWSFNNHKLDKIIKRGNIVQYRGYAKVDRNCDYFIFVCTDDDFSIKKCYIVPKKIIGISSGIAIGEAKKSKYHKWEGRWDLLQPSYSHNKEKEDG